MKNEFCSRQMPTRPDTFQAMGTRITGGCMCVGTKIFFKLILYSCTKRIGIESILLPEPGACCPVPRQLCFSYQVCAAVFLLFSFSLPALSDVSRMNSLFWPRSSPVFYLLNCSKKKTPQKRGLYTRVEQYRIPEEPITAYLYTARISCYC